MLESRENGHIFVWLRMCYTHTSQTSEDIFLYFKMEENHVVFSAIM